MAVNKLILITALLTPLFSVADTKLNECKEVSKVARVVMEKRQQNVSIVKLLEAVGDDSISQNIIILAYESPLYSTEEMKSKTASDFANRVFLICFNAKTGV